VRRLFDVDIKAPIRRIFHSHCDDEFGIETVEDVQDVIDVNKENYNQRAHERWGSGVLGSHVAQIPATVWWDLKRRGIADDEKKLLAWLNDSDNQLFRSRPGRL